MANYTEGARAAHYTETPIPRTSMGTHVDCMILHVTPTATKVVERASFRMHLNGESKPREEHVHSMVPSPLSREPR